MKFQAKSILKSEDKIESETCHMSVHFYAIKKEKCVMFNQPFPLLYMLSMQVQCNVTKCMLTFDPSQIQHLLDRLGEGYDQAVLECQDRLADSLKLICSKPATTICLFQISKQ